MSIVKTLILSVLVTAPIINFASCHNPVVDSGPVEEVVSTVMDMDIPLSDNIDPLKIKADLEERDGLVFEEIDLAYECYDNDRYITIYTEYDKGVHSKIVAKSRKRKDLTDRGLEDERIDNLMGLDYLMETYPNLSQIDIGTGLNEIKIIERDAANFETVNPLSSDSGDRAYTYTLRLDDNDLFIQFSAVVSDTHYTLGYNVIDSPLSHIESLTGHSAPSIVDDYLVPNGFSPDVGDNGVEFMKLSNQSDVRVTIQYPPNISYDVSFKDGDIIMSDVQEERVEGYVLQLFEMFNIVNEKDMTLISEAVSHQLGLANDSDNNQGCFDETVETSSMTLDVVIGTVNIDDANLDETNKDKMNYVVTFKNIILK